MRVASDRVWFLPQDEKSSPKERYFEGYQKINKASLKNAALRIEVKNADTNLFNKVRGWKTLKDIVEEVSYDRIEDVKHMFGREKAEQTDGLEDIKRIYGKARARG